MSRAKEFQAKKLGSVSETAGPNLPVKIAKILIGIDTGTQTGFATYCPYTKRLLEVKTLPIHSAILEVLTYHRSEIFVRVEDARLAVHGRSSKTDSAKLQGAGSIKRDAVIWEDFLKDHEIPYQMVRPNKRITKLTPEQFSKTTNYKGRTSKHSRDAAMLIFGL